MEAHRNGFFLSNDCIDFRVDRAHGTYPEKADIALHDAYRRRIVFNLCYIFSYRKYINNNFMY